MGEKKGIMGNSAFPSRSGCFCMYPASREAYDADNVLKQTTTNKQMAM